MAVEQAPHNISCIIYTDGQVIIGEVRSLHWRLSDALNSLTQNYLMMFNVRRKTLGRGPEDEEQLARYLVRVDAIVLALPTEAQEQEDMVQSESHQTLRVPRGPIRTTLRTHAWVMEGILHLPEGVELLQHMHYRQRSFLPMTDVRVISAYGAFTTPFVLVHRERVEGIAEWAADGEMLRAVPELTPTAPATLPSTDEVPPPPPAKPRIEPPSMLPPAATTPRPTQPLAPPLPERPRPAQPSIEQVRSVLQRNAGQPAALTPANTPAAPLHPQTPAPAAATSTDEGHAAPGVSTVTEVLQVLFPDADPARLQVAAVTLVALGSLRERALRPGEVLYTHGSDPTSVYVVTTGLLESVRDADVQTPRHVATYRPGEAFGRLRVMGERRRTSTVTAVANSTVLEVSEAAMLELARRFPAHVARFLRNLQGRMSIS